MGFFDKLKKSAEQLLKDKLGEETLNNLKEQTKQVGKDLAESGEKALNWTADKVEKLQEATDKALTKAVDKAEGVAAKAEEFINGKLGGQEEAPAAEEPAKRTKLDKPAPVLTEFEIEPSPVAKLDEKKVAEQLNTAAKKKPAAAKKTAAPAAKAKKPAPQPKKPKQ